jgi:hypothetical protein
MSHNSAYNSNYCIRIKYVLKSVPMCLYQIVFCCTFLVTITACSLQKQLGYWLQNLGFMTQFAAGAGSFLFSEGSKPVLGPTEPPIQRVPGALSRVIM